MEQPSLARRWIAKHVAFIVLTAAFASWMIILAVMSLQAERVVTFIDAISGQDVSAEYASIVPVERVLIEPLVGFALVVASDPLGIALVVAIAYAVARVAYLAVARVGLRGNVKAAAAGHVLRNVVNCYWKYFLGLLGLGLAWLFSGAALHGFLYLNNNFMAGIQLLVVAGLAILVAKGAQHVAIACHPRLVLRVKPAKPWSRLPRTSWKYRVHKVFDVAGREARYGVSIYLIFLTCCFGLASVHLPTQRIETTLGPNEYLVDMHVHTTFSDGTLTPAERVNWYVQQGIHAAAFSDHENQRGVVEAMAHVQQHGLPFTVIPAQEYTHHELSIHLNIFGVNVTYAPDFREHPSSPDVLFMNVPDMIADVHARGGFVVVNHYRSQPGFPYTYEQLRDWGVDGFEVINSGRIQGRGDILDFCLANNLAAIAATDEHGNGEVNSFMKVQVNDPANLTGLFNVLKTNTHQAVRIVHQQDRVPAARGPFRVVAIAINYFLGIGQDQAASWLAWSAGAYGLLLAVLAGLRRASTARVEAKIVAHPSKRSVLFGRPAWWPRARRAAGNKPA